ncbi:Excreted virulence factor EspC, type VII ESX diderm [Amycolatopsis marina]|uniref:Excreted virulence factor EspC, type VII ESX diderm n=1 Tax=Amycolatopsis marina TaxID=490629 RepID=A0A1I0XIJ2_9PSEU|nr:type VII secretion target [Amycolatopsis marina]SFB00939.1 Excreted virulence factor EspC, type VII ESX diderm [Amycolatopsis marina]
MGFKVEPKSIGTFSEKMDGLVVDANAAKTYAEDWLSIEGSDARIFATIAGAAEEAKSALSENYERLAKIQGTAAVELDKAATMYDNTETAEAERIDGTYKAGE